MSNLSNKISPSVVFLSHGGGPLPLLGDPAHQSMLTVLNELTATLARPKAIVVISAHWEEQQPTVTSAKSPSLLYDYYGFPEEAYKINYPASGFPELANKITDLLVKQGINAKQDNQRGFDHGLFVPLKLMYPLADIPCIQLSLVHTLDAKEHILIGKCLVDLKHDNVLIIGSGFSFHNLNEFFRPTTQATQAMNRAFEEWLQDTCCNSQYNEQQREQRLIDWTNAPGASFCHPRAEHLLPLMVCYGAAVSPAIRVFNFEIMGKKVSTYCW